MILVSPIIVRLVLAPSQILWHQRHGWPQPANYQSQELSSCLPLTNLISSISTALMTEFSLQEPCWYTDSKVALHWIRGTTKEWKPFVENRVNQVRGLIPSEYWKHCKPYPAPLEAPTFSYTGVDLAGPLYIKVWPCQLSSSCNAWWTLSSIQICQPTKEFSPN